MKESLIILCVVTLALTRSDRCMTKRVENGECRVFRDCPELSEIAKVLSIANFVNDYGGCGLDENQDFRVCCPVNATRDLNCRPPGVLIRELGCIIPVNTTMTWDKAQANCLQMNGQLVEGFNKEQQNVMFRNFENVLRADPFVGVRYGKWAVSKEIVPEELWVKGFPVNDTGLSCGIRLTKMQEYCCDCEQTSVCQIKPSGVINPHQPVTTIEDFDIRSPISRKLDHRRP